MAGNEPKCNPYRYNVFRVIGSLFVLAGGLFWSSVVFFGFHGFSSFVQSAGNAMIWVALTVAVFGVGLRFPRVAAVMLAIAAAGAVAYGIQIGWELGVWMLVLVWIIAPIVTSGVMYGFAAREQHVCDLESHALPGVAA